MTETRSIEVCYVCPLPSRAREHGAVGARLALCGTFVALRSLLISMWQHRYPLPLLRLAGLTRLAAYLLAGVADPLALIRFRRPHTPDACCLLTHQLLIDANNGESSVSIESVGHPFRRGHPHGVREPH